VFSTLDNGLVGNKHSAVELRGKVADKLFTTSHVLVHEDVFKLIDKRLVKQLSDQFEPQARLQLLQEFKSFH